MVNRVAGCIGRHEYAVGREKVREYARAVGESAPLHHEPGAAREAGYADVVAPPMFAAVYAFPAVTTAVLDPRLGIDASRLLHFAQEFRWHALVVAGDVIATEVELEDVQQRRGFALWTFASASRNDRDEPTADGRWTMLVRGGRPA